MTNEEFSNEFDVLYNSITSNQAPGLDEYEKSVFLTQAQEDLVRCYFDPKSNKVQEGFDGSQKRQYDFSSLIKTTELQMALPLINSDSFRGLFEYIGDIPLFDRSSIPYISPDNLFLTINESIYNTSTKERFLVVPITYDEYFRLKSKPYGMPLKRQAWRLITNKIGKLSTIGSYIYIPKTKDSDHISLWFTSISDKPVTLIINKSSTESPITLIPPKIEETADKIVITLFPNKGGMVNYKRAYLLDKDKLKEAGLAEYILPLDGNTGQWPTMDLPKESTTLTAPGPKKATNQIFEVIGKFKSTDSLVYKIRYIEELKPIILTDDLATQNLSIKGYNNAMTSTLPSSCHDEILKRAVELAKAAYTGGLQEVLTVGNQSSTNIGYMPSSNRS